MCQYMFDFQTNNHDCLKAPLQTSRLTINPLHSVSTFGATTAEILPSEKENYSTSFLFQEKKKKPNTALSYICT